MNEKFPIGDSEVEKSVLDNIRLKVTDTCPWQCSFCHNEGGRFTTDMHWGPELEEVIKSLQQVIPNLKEIHYTGGEPTRNPELAAITVGLTAMGFEIKTTTNGQFSKEDMDKLVLSGLNSFNFSVHSLDPERFLKFQTGRGKSWIEGGKTGGTELPLADVKQKKIENLEWAEKQIERELEMILYAKEKGIDVKINSVISGEEDMDNADDIFNWAKKNQIPLRLLNDLGNGTRSIDAIKKFINSTGAKEILRKISSGTSSCSTVYKTEEGYEFVFKQIRDLKLESMCQNCPRAENGTCEEQFYGIRLQQGEDGRFYVLLCIQESNPNTQMTIEDFISSPQLKEINSYLE